MFFVTGPPFAQMSPLAQSYKWRKLRGVALPPYKGVPHTLPPLHWTTSLLISPFFLHPDKTGCACVCRVDGQNMLMSFPQRIFAKCGNSYLDRQQLAGHCGILEQAGNLKLAKLNQKNSLKFLTLLNICSITLKVHDLVNYCAIACIIHPIHQSQNISEIQNTGETFQVQAAFALPHIISL